LINDFLVLQSLLKCYEKGIIVGCCKSRSSGSVFSVGTNHRRRYKTYKTNSFKDRSTMKYTLAVSLYIWLSFPAAWQHCASLQHRRQALHVIRNVRTRRPHCDPKCMPHSRCSMPEMSTCGQLSKQAQCVSSQSRRRRFKSNHPVRHVWKYQRYTFTLSFNFDLVSSLFA
jgi:hypothetical protein